MTKIKRTTTQSPEAEYGINAWQNEIITLIWTILVVEMWRRLNFNETDDAINALDFNTMLLVRLAKVDNGNIACCTRFSLTLLHDSNEQQKAKTWNFGRELL